ncbi:MAG: NFACT family protein [Clostridia bacterium]|nr:NFACT family protein [Clostridia bacterium]
MAIDGAYLYCLRAELEERLLGSRVDKIHQPSKEELVFSLRSQTGHVKLYISARVNSPRVQFTDISLENPPSPPMFCMLLRKRLSGARLVAVRQIGLERVLYFDFDAVNELGDAVRLTLAAEIMGRYSNIILIDGDSRVVDAIKRVDLTMSPMRPILPGIEYIVPLVDSVRVDLLNNTVEEVAARIREGGAPLDRAIRSCTQGLSPLVCREIAYQTLRGEEDSGTLTEAQEHRLERALYRVQQALLTPEKRTPYVLYRTDHTPLDFSFLPITQYGLSAVGREADGFSRLLDEFYAEKDAAERMRQRSQDVWRILNTAIDRISRKLGNQRRELKDSTKRDEKRLYADLINANLHSIPKGAAQVELINYYEETCPTVTVPLDPALTAVQNAQRYYKDYRKAKTAEEILGQQIAIGEQDLVYLDSVFDALSRATTVRELEELRAELMATGYMRRQGSKQKPPPPTKPLEFVSDDGFTILVGRNNVQNDKLTTRIAKGSDWWFHTKNIAGSHTVILTDGVTPPDTTVMQAAILAATHSKAADSAQVPVDYTQIRNVKKPAGAKPGMVIYETNRTVYVTPDKTLAARLLKA